MGLPHPYESHRYDVTAWFDPPRVGHGGTLQSVGLDHVPTTPAEVVQAINEVWTPKRRTKALRHYTVVDMKGECQIVASWMR